MLTPMGFVSSKEAETKIQEVKDAWSSEIYLAGAWKGAIWSKGYLKYLHDRERFGAKPRFPSTSELWKTLVLYLFVGRSIQG